MNEFVCNYAIARFRPYRETGEFVNVGVVLLCPQLDFFDYVFETRKHKRITDFFPELDYEVFKAGLSGLQKELTRVTARNAETSQLVLTGEAQVRVALFKELVRTRETLFHFSEVRTILAAEPAAKLGELFDFYIKRQFARDRDYQEVIMRRQLAEFLQKVNLAQYYKQEQKVGDESYNVILPFVRFDGATIKKAIKPLHLAKTASTEIYRHGDAWISTVRRLRGINRLPKDFLFTVKHPTEGAKLQTAATEICTELESLDTLTVPFADRNRIEEFAR